MNKVLNDKLIGKVLKTFIEGFIASLIVSMGSISDYSDLNILKNILIGAIAMGISAVLNLLQMYLKGDDYGKSNT